MSVNQDTAPIEYRDVFGFPGYCVGDDGSVWSCRAWVPGKPRRQCGITGSRWRQLKPRRLRKYHSVALFDVVGNRVTRYVAHLVLETFVGPRPANMEACHDPDPDPANNALMNLRWDSKAANAQDRERWRAMNNIAAPKNFACRGDKNPKATLTDEQVHDIRRQFAIGVPQYELRRRLGVPSSTMSMICTRKRRTYS